MQIENEESIIQNPLKEKIIKNQSNKLTLNIVAFIIIIIALFDTQRKCYSFDDFCYNLPYGYYTILKFVVCGTFLYYSYIVYKEKNINITFIISSLIAIIYNPLITVALEKEQWRLINIITLLLIGILSIPKLLDFCNNYLIKKEKERKETFKRAEKIVVDNIKDPVERQVQIQIKEKHPEKYEAYIYSKLLSVTKSKKEDELCEKENKSTYNSELFSQKISTLFESDRVTISTEELIEDMKKFKEFNEKNEKS